MKKYIVLSWLLLGVVFQAEAKVTNLGYFELDNGLKVIVAENHKAPVVLTQILYKVGSVDDPLGKGGLAHMLEHMMFRGTKFIPDQKFNQLTDEHGAENNAYTTSTHTAYYEFSDVSKFDLMLAMEADRMKNLQINPDAFYKERDVVLQERMQRFETKPFPLFLEILNKTLWQDHPAANPVSGSIAEIKSLTPKDAMAFYQKYYRPDNAYLLVSGDVKVADVQKSVSKYFGDIQKKNVPLVKTYDPSRNVMTDMKLKLEGVTQPRLVYNIRFEKNQFTQRELLALDVLQTYLAIDDISYLPEKLVYQDKKVLGIDLGYTYENDLGGKFMVYVVPIDEKLSLEDFKTMVEKTIEQGINELTDVKLQKVKNRMLSDTVYLLENPKSTISFIASFILEGYSIENIENYDKLLQNVTVHDIADVWDKVVSGSTKVSGYLEGAK